MVVGPLSYGNFVLAGAPRHQNLVNHTSLVDWPWLSREELWLLICKSEASD
jgi:hypothetical protein